MAKRVLSEKELVQRKNAALKSGAYRKQLINPGNEVVCRLSDEIQRAGRADDSLRPAIELLASTILVSRQVFKYLQTHKDLPIQEYTTTLNAYRGFVNSISRQLRSCGLTADAVGKAEHNAFDDYKDFMED